ncbi:universal stress protein [Oxalobacter paraformigenes]|uniref:UspA domain-containing protein n=1 Tax=Oxalobacter paraformigenes TaxID=556268 RepID=C3X2Z5_9BURK|nr:universal stress protein [Oxalobacter paraformigenes]EEO27581.1 hypothetical protein OFAG_00734 [Oxalobacter paraformigenes]
MKKPDSIMVATDMSECATMAENRAAMLCAQLGKNRLDIVNVQDLSAVELLKRALKSPAEIAEKAVRQGLSDELSAVIRRLEKDYGIQCELLIRFGKAATEIMHEITERQTGLLVMGAHGNSPHSHAFLGNLPGKLLQISPSPLLIVRTEAKQAYRKILIAVDFSEISLYQARQALALARPDTEIVLLHAYEVPNEGMMRYANISQGLLHEFRSDIRLKAGAEMQAFIAALKTPHHVTSVIQLGVPHTVIREHAASKKPDLLVMGKQGRSRFEEFLLGSTSRNTLYETDCDILIVPPTAAVRQIQETGKDRKMEDVSPS